jgi:hypothetical protein
MPGKGARIQTTLIVASGVVAACVLLWTLRSSLQDQPIPGGIVAYRSHSFEGRGQVHCACGHKGFFLLTDRLVLWYVTDHDALQPRGQIVRSDGNLLTVQPIHEPFHGEEPPKPFTIEKREGEIQIVQPATKYSSVRDYSLKLTYLGPEIRERVEKFNFEEWNASQDDR